MTGTHMTTLAEDGGVTLLGCGKMGGAMLDGWLAAGLPAAAARVIDPHPSDRVRALAEQGLALNDGPGAPAVCVLAVKPQMMAEAIGQVAALGGGGTLFLSIAAGTPLAYFERTLGPGTPVIRAMPNTPAAVGAGVTALVPGTAATEAHMALAEALAAAVGTTVRLESESQIDAVTALSGSGPAYVFHMMEAMAAAGVAQGLAPELAMALARQTVIGAGALAAGAAEEAAQLRVNVTSPNGVTAAALEVLMAEGAGLTELMTRAVAAGTARSVALQG